MVNNGEYAGFHKWWYPKNEWFSGKSQTKMGDKWSTPILGNFHISPYVNWQW
jgi:hypothetical protein